MRRTTFLAGPVRPCRWPAVLVGLLLLLPLALALPSGTASAQPGVPASVSAAPAPASVPTRRFERFTRVIGHSWRNRPIHAYFRGDPTAKLQVVVIGQTHGNEPAGRDVAQWIRLHLNPSTGTGLWVVPTINPDGHVAKRRQNARRVDLNRNFPTNGWRGTASSCCWGGRSAGSERETKAIVRFLAEVRPRYVVSLHQPFGVVARNGKNRYFENRLAKELGLPLDAVSIGAPGSRVAPSLTSWYNAKHGAYGTSVTVELPRTTTARYRRGVVAPALLRAMLVRG